MPRYGSQDSDSDSPEPGFRLERPALLAVSGSTAGSIQTPWSLLKEAGNTIDISRRCRNESESEDPFRFTSQDGEPDPPRKRIKHGSDQERPETKEQESEKVKGIPRNIDTTSPQTRGKRKYGAQEGKKELSVEHVSKRKRKEETRSTTESSSNEVSEVHTQRFKRITHRKTIKTVTTNIRHLVKIEMINESSGDLVESLAFEEEETPEVKREEKETREEEEEIVTSFTEAAIVQAQEAFFKSSSRKAPKTRSSGDAVNLDVSLPVTRTSPRRTSCPTSSSEDSISSPFGTRRTSKSKDLGLEISTSKKSLQTRPFTKISSKSLKVSTTRTSESSEESRSSPNSYSLRASSSRSRSKKSKETRQMPSPECGGERVQSVQKSPSAREDGSLPLVHVETLKSGARPLITNTRVLAKWLDKFYYPGKVISGPTKYGWYWIVFDDGDKRRVRSEDLLVKDKLPLGQCVLVQGADNYYSPGRIIGHYREANITGYAVERDDRVIKRYPQCKVF